MNAEHGSKFEALLDNGNLSIFVKNPITKQTNIKQNKTNYKTQENVHLTIFSYL